MSQADFATSALWTPLFSRKLTQDPSLLGRIKGKSRGASSCISAFDRNCTTEGCWHNKVSSCQLVLHHDALFMQYCCLRCGPEKASRGYQGHSIRFKGLSSGRWWAENHLWVCPRQSWGLRWALNGCRADTNMPEIWPDAEQRQGRAKRSWLWHLISLHAGTLPNATQSTSQVFSAKNSPNKVQNHSIDKTFPIGGWQQFQMCYLPQAVSCCIGKGQRCGKLTCFLFPFCSLWRASHHFSPWNVVVLGHSLASPP